ncbi:MAG: hypothetical protein Ct9H300mP25_10410 [Acidobacteriota bacterium]|nr:MAG: hypothetical protein Ct9H300mP25_10410 [Acidobacteriota bacterium]
MQSLRRLWSDLDRGADCLRQPEGYQKLAADIQTPIQLGENFYGPRALHAAIQMEACDLVMPDFMRIGGVTGWLQAPNIAEPQGFRCRRISTPKLPHT